MRFPTRLLCLLLLSLVASLSGRPASASTSIYLQTSGVVQGPILGEATAIAHANWIDIFAYSWGVAVPVGPAGVPSGPAQPQALTVTKNFDRSSVKLLTATLNGEMLQPWTMEFVNGSTLAVYYRITMTGAHIMADQQSGSSEIPTESISFAYSTITLIDVLQGISATFNWSSTGTAAVATQSFLAKGILLPPAPNPTRGETQFRFSLPSGMDSDLSLFDAQGRRVRALHHGPASAQSVVSVWDGTDDSGAKVAPGIYVARLAYAGEVVTQHFAVVR